MRKSSIIQENHNYVFTFLFLPRSVFSIFKNFEKSLFWKIYDFRHNENFSKNCEILRVLEYQSSGLSLDYVSSRNETENL